MAFDEGLAERIREVLRDGPDISERRMFGGIAFLSGGFMFVGIVGDVLMARVGPDAYDQALKRAHVREMDFTGKPMKGYVFVDPPGFEDDADLEHWVRACRAFVRSLPEKAAMPARPKAAQPRARARRPAKKGHR